MTADSSPGSGPDWRTNLLLNLDEVLGNLGAELAASSFLNAYLLAVAAEQVMDDWMQREALADRAAAFVQGSDARGAHRAGEVIGAASRTVHRARSLTVGTKAVGATRQAAASLVSALADLVMGAAPGCPVAGGLAALLREMRSSVLVLPAALRESTPVLPSCFQTFDLGLDDVRLMAARLLAAPAMRNRPVCVVGVRTSGSYLAPLLAAVLRGEQVADVETVTVRPGMVLQGVMAGTVRGAARRGAAFVVTDDPPVTGSSLMRAIAELERVGVAAGSISVCFPSFLDARLDPRLERYSPVVLAWDEWAVHRRLTAAVVQRDLEPLLGPGTAIQSVELLEARRPRRAEAHVRGVYRVVLADAAPDDGRGGEVLSVAVQGVGLGYYGEHVEVVADVVAPYGPRIFGLKEGLLFREWFDPVLRVDDTEPDGDLLGRELAAYVATRRERLPVEDDRSLTLAGSRPVWETASVAVSQSFGRAWPVAQVLLVNDVVRRILHVTRPSVVDGTMDLENWFVESVDSRPRLRTAGLQQRAYWHHGLSSYDAVFDLAGAMDSAGDVPASRALRSHYTACTGEPVEAERWLLLRLAQLWGRRRRNPAAAGATDAALSRVLQEYYATVFLQGIDRSPPSGPLCALDIDGVLETDHLGFPSLTAASASALSALLRHGCRPVLVTGRSIGEVRERCMAYGLQGGVGEYGSALYVADGDVTVDLVPPGTARALNALRTRLEATPGIAVEPRYVHGVRAWVPRGSGRSPLSEQHVAAATAGLSGLRFVHGEGQTDFVPVATDKGTGLRELLARLRPTAGHPERPIALAVGDTQSDAPMLAMATHPAVPAHAPAALGGASAWRASRPYQAGLAQVVDHFLGHDAGGRHATSGRGRLGAPSSLYAPCLQCAQVPHQVQRAALLSLLSIGEAGWQGMPSRIFHAERALRRTRKAAV